MAAARLLPLVALLLSAPACGQPQGQDVIIGKWRVSQGAIPNTCQAITRVNAHQVVNVIQTNTGIIRFFVQDSELNVVDAEVYAGALSWDDWATSQEVEFSAVHFGEDGVLWGLVEPTFMNNLRESGELLVRIPVASVEIGLPVDDADALAAAFGNCLDGL